MVELFIDIAEKSDFADFEPLQTLSCRAPTSGGWCGTVNNLYLKKISRCNIFCRYNPVFCIQRLAPGLNLSVSVNF